MPVALADKYDGWSSRNVVDCYLKLCRVLFERIGSRCRYWLTFNEINAVRGYASCGTRNVYNQTHYQAVHQQFLASALATKMADPYTHLTLPTTTHDYISLVHTPYTKNY